MIERQRGWPQRPCGQAVSEPSGYPRMAGPDGDCGLGSCSMEPLVMVRLQPRDGREEPDQADSGAPDAPCPLLGATQSFRSALLKGCSSIIMGLNLWFGGHIQETCWPSAFLHQWFSTGGDSASRIWHGQETFFLVVKAGERGVLPAPSAGKAGTLLKSPQAHSQPPHLRVTPLSYDNGGVVEKPGSAAREMNFFSILDPETHFLTRV